MPFIERDWVKKLWTALSPLPGLLLAGFIIGWTSDPSLFQSLMIFVAFFFSYLLFGALPISYLDAKRERREEETTDALQ